MNARSSFFFFLFLFWFFFFLNYWTTVLEGVCFYLIFSIAVEYYILNYFTLQQHFTGSWVNNMIKHHALIPITITSWSCSLDLFEVITLCGFLCLFFVVSDMPGSPHNQFTFRPLPPPPPPPHACTCARKPPPTADSLQRRSMTTRSQPSPAAPTPPTSTQDSVHLHNSWVLNSNIPLETRYAPTCCTQHISNVGGGGGEMEWRPDTDGDGELKVSHSGHASAFWFEAVS